MAPSQESDGPAGAARLRAAIDSGRARDKVPFPDPAAAPLGTDEEAAGTAVGEEAADMALRREVRGPGAERPASTTPIFVYAGILAAIAATIGAAIWLGAS